MGAGQPRWSEQGREMWSPVEMESVAWPQQWGSRCDLSCLSSPRLHADPGVSKRRWFLWGLVTSGQ